MVQPGLSTPHEYWAPAPRPLVGLGRAIYILATVTAVVAVGRGLAGLYDYGLAKDYLDGRDVAIADVVAADHHVSQLATIYLIALVATAVLVIVWTYQARQNAEVICTAQHRLGRGWAIGGWFCPVVSFWFPAKIVEDTYRASMPGTPRDLVSFEDLPHVDLIRFWWVPFVLANVISALSTYNSNTLSGLHAQFVELAIAGALLLASAVALTKIISEIGDWQQQPRTA